MRPLRTLPQLPHATHSLYIMHERCFEGDRCYYATVNAYGTHREAVQSLNDSKRDHGEIRSTVPGALSYGIPCNVDNVTTFSVARYTLADQGR